MTNKIMQKLREPFAPEDVTWKPGSTTKDNTRCLAMAYADTRCYQDALDEAFGFAWATDFDVLTDKSVLCRLTITANGTTVTRSATAEDTDLMSAEARAFKRACSAFGLGRFLYDLPSVWVEYDAKARAITDAGRAKLDAKYRAWYARQSSTTDSAEKPDTTPQPAQRQQPQATPEPWQAWQSAEDAYRWAVESGICAAIPHARNALKKIVTDDFDGNLTKANFQAVMQAFYHDRIQKQAQAQQPDAQPA